MRTQTEAFWQKEWKVSSEDIEYLYSSFLEDETPRSPEELALRVMSRRCQVEEQQLAREMDQGPLYRPQDKHEVGQRLVFPSLDRAIAEVASVRPGHNPQYGSFEVIGVQFEGQSAICEFASSFSLPHRLNDVESFAKQEEASLSLEQIFALQGQAVQAKLDAALAADAEFARLGKNWFLRSLMPEVGVGHLNIAEAMIDMAQRPLSTAELLHEVDLKSTLGEEVNRAALESALAQDGRFDAMGEEAERHWFLISLEPPAVAATPLRLQQAYPRPTAPLLLAELAEIAQEIGDELDGKLGKPEEQPDRASFILNYPHSLEGTVPLTPEIRRLLPDGGGFLYPITFKEGNLLMPGWVLEKRGYAWGLGEWYRKQELPLGTTISLTRTENPAVLAVSYDKSPRKGEWVREARAAEGKLTFEMQKRAYTCRYDRYLLLHVAEQKPLDELAEKFAAENKTLDSLILEIAPELIKLSSQGVFQAKTLYAAINLVRRCGALPIFAELTRRACFDPLGSGNWGYDPNLKDVVYGSEDEMRERAHSQRTDIAKDAVITL
jgi:hypothetical protein